jgi:hypothetical protein
MARFRVNLGSSVTVEAADEGEAIALAKESPDKNYFHMQVQRLVDPEQFTPEARQAEYDEEVARGEHAH